MRYAGNFHQEWGYLAPAPSFIRTARVILVAAAVGATAGAGVVFSLVGREDTETSVAARTLARPAEAASAQLNVLPPAPAALASGAQDHAPRSLAADAPRAGAADSESKPSSTTMAPAGIAALAEVPAVTEDASPHPATSPSAAVPSPVAAPARTRGLVAARFGSISGSRGAGKGCRFAGRRHWRARSRRGARATEGRCRQEAHCPTFRFAGRFVENCARRILHECRQLREPGARRLLSCEWMERRLLTERRPFSELVNLGAFARRTVSRRRHARIARPVTCRLLGRQPC